MLRCKGINHQEGQIVNDQVKVVVESEEEQKMEGFKDGGELVELGLVSKDTKGVGFVFPDGGVGNRW